MRRPGSLYIGFTRLAALTCMLLQLMAASRAYASAVSPRQVSMHSMPPLLFEQVGEGAGAHARFQATGGGLRVDLDLSGASIHAGEASAVHMTLLEANPAARVVGVEPPAGRVSTMRGADPRGWQADVAAYGRVQYEAVYPGIDLVFHGGQGHLEYDFVVAPGADAARIALHFDGAEAIEIDPTGALTLRTPSGSLRHEPPTVYQVAAGTRRQIHGTYTLSGDGRVGFELGPYDSSLPLVIDPRLVYSRRLEDTVRGRASVQGAAIAVDAAGHAYVTGTLDDDAFVAKLSPDGDSMVFLTLLGGSDDDAGAGIALGPRGEIFITGVTRSQDFPGARSTRKRAGGQQDAFVVHLSADGSRLLGTAILGGAGDDAGAGIAVDATGAVVITGTTSSFDFPTTSNAPQPALAGMDDAFVARLSANGLRGLYSTYLGGSGIDRGAAVALDSRGGVHVVGSTASADFPTTASAQPVYGGPGRAGTGDGFAASLDASGSRLTYSTFLGGRDDDEATSIALDSLGAVLIAGTTASEDFPAASSLQKAQGGGTDAFIARLDATGRFLNATWLGSAGDDRATGLAVDAKGDVYVAGITSSARWPAAGDVAADAPATHEPGPASFVLRLRDGGTKLRDAARLAGNKAGNEAGREAGGANVIDLVAAIAKGPGADLYLTGSTRALEGAGNTRLDTFAGTQATGFVARVAFSALAAGCPGTINFTNAAGTGLWEDPNNWDDTSRTPESFDDVCITGGFDVTISSGTHEANSLINDGKLTIAGGSTSLTLYTESQLYDFTLAGGTLKGPGTINIDGLVLWSGGRIEGPAGHPSILNTRGTLILDTTSFHQYDSRILNIGGTVQQLAGVISGGGGAVINLTGAWMADAGEIRAAFTTGNATFNNYGVFEKKTAGNFTIGQPFNNAGTVDVKNGKLTFGSNFNQTAGSTLLGGGSLAAGALTIRGGTLAGTGSITGNVLMAGGTISPGFSPGSVAITGEYAQDAASTLSIEAGGLAPGTQFDQIVLDGTAAVNLSGTLNVTLAGGYIPVPGDRLDIMTFASRSGTFSTLNIPPPNAGIEFSVSYGSSAVTLVAASQKSANLSIDKRDSPDPALLDQPLTYTLTVTNAGPDDASDVKLLDPLPLSTTFVSATGSGWSCDNSTGVLTCTMPSLAAGATSTVTVEVIPTQAPTLLLNTATVSSRDKDALPGNNTAVQTTTVSTSAVDLAVSVVDGPDPVAIESQLTLDITVTNNGPTQATSVRVTDTFPPGSTFLGSSGLGWSCQPATGTINCLTSVIGVGESSLVSVRLRMPFSGGQALNTVVASSSSGDPSPADNTAVATTTVLPGVADVSVTSIDTPDPVGTFDPLAYGILVANSGPDTAFDLVLVDTLPAGCVFLNAAGTGWSCQHAAGVVTCRKGSLPSGTSSLVEITLTAPGASGSVTNKAEVSSVAGDPVLSNNISLQNTSVVLSQADLSATLIDSVDPVFAGEPLSYTLTVSNAGPNLANIVNATVILPPGAAFVSAAGTGWTCIHLTGTVTCAHPVLTVGPASPILIAVAAPETGGLTASNVSVSALTDDPNPSNNTATAETIVFLPSADLSLMMTDSPDPVTQTSSVVYTIRVTNLGPDPAKRVKVVSTLPAGISFVQMPAPGGPWTCSALLPKVTCFISDAPQGPAPDINIGVPVPAGFGTMSNSAVVSAVVVDVDPANNTASQQTATVPLGANMKTSQETDPDPVESGEEYIYTIVASNDGPLVATGVQLVEVLPPEVEFVDADPPPDATQSEPNGALKLTYNIGVLDPHVGALVFVTVRCIEPNPALASTSTVQSAQYDPAPADNTVTKLTNCFGPNGSVLFAQRLITPYTTSSSMPAVITVNGGVVDPNSVAITRIDDQPITPIPGSAASGKYNFNRQTLLRTIEGMLLACTPQEGVPLKLKVSGRTMTGDFFTATDTITYAKETPCADGSESCVRLKPTSVKVLSFSTTPVQVTIGLCLGRIIQGTVQLTKVNGISIPSLRAMAHPKKPDRVMLDRPALNDALLRAMGFCPAKELLPVTLTFRGLTQSLKTFEVTTPFVVNCGSGV